MKKSILPKNHYFINITKDVQEICTPFFKKYKLKDFYYVRMFDDGSMYTLITHTEYLKYHIEQEFMVAPPVSSDLLATKFQFLGVPSGKHRFNQLYHISKSMFDIDYPFYFTERYYGYVDLYSFAASSKEFNIVNFYINNLDLLEGFKKYFKEKAENLIIKANLNKLMLPVHMRPNYTGLMPNDEITTNINLLKDRTKNLNQLLQLHFNTKLTPRELQSLSYLLKGRTAVETSVALNISPKTVESYIDSVKTKLNCLTRADLFDKALDSHLLNLIIKL